MFKWLQIILLCVATCVAYGIIHDQITARICVEYFTIGHPDVFGTDDPTLLGLGWGVIATWWVGVLVGVPLAMVSRYGTWPRREPGSLIYPLLVLMTCSFLVATLAGLLSWLAATRHCVYLHGYLANAVPSEQRVPFLIDLWAHNASYLSGFVGGLVLIVQVYRSRRQMAFRQQHSTSQQEASVDASS